MRQVILVNGWLNMPSGKMAAQVAHASMAFLTNAIINGTEISEDITENWIKASFGKIVLEVRTEEELGRVLKKLDKNEVKYSKIIDNGLTVFNGVHTHTCTGFEPMHQEDINKYFGSLPLLK